MTSELSFDELSELIAGKRRRGNHVEVPCPLCGPKCRKPFNRRRKTLWVGVDNGDDFLNYKCHRCEANGWVRRKGPSLAVKRTEKPFVKEADNSDKARWLWGQAQPLEKSLAAIYLKHRMCFMPCDNIRSLPAQNGYPPAMIARFASANGETNGIHLTRLAANGTRKADVENPKITLGPSMGWPIIITKSKPALIIAEGIEDALSFALAATHCSVWAAGSAGRIPPVLGRAKAFDKVFVAIDNDAAGALALERSLKVRPDLIPVNLTEIMRSREAQDANKVIAERGVAMLKGYLDLAECQMRVDRGAA